MRSILSNRIVRKAAFVLCVLVIMISPSLLQDFFYSLFFITAEHPLIDFRGFAWGDSAVFIILFLDLFLTVFCLTSVYGLFRKARPLQNRYLSAFAFYCAAYHAFLAVFNLVILTNIDQTNPLLYFIADFASVALIWFSIRRRIHASPPRAQNNRILSALCMTALALSALAALLNITVRLFFPDYFPVYDIYMPPVYDMFLLPEPILMISQFMNFLTQSFGENVFLPDFLSSIHFFYKDIFRFWLLAFFGALAVMGRKQPVDPPRAINRLKMPVIHLTAGPK